MADDSKVDDIMYKYVARPLYKLGEYLSKESPDDSIKRYEGSVSNIESGKAMVKNPYLPKRRIQDLKEQQSGRTQKAGKLAPIKHKSKRNRKSQRAVKRA